MPINNAHQGPNGPKKNQATPTPTPTPVATTPTSSNWLLNLFGLGSNPANVTTSNPISNVFLQDSASNLFCGYTYQANPNASEPWYPSQGPVQMPPQGFFSNTFFRFLQTMNNMTGGSLTGLSNSLFPPQYPPGFPVGLPGMPPGMPPPGPPREYLELDANQNLVIKGTSSSDTITFKGRDQFTEDYIFEVNGKEVFVRPDTIAAAQEVIVYAGAGVDTVDLSGFEVGTTIHGGSGDDILTGGEGDDLIFGDAGNDVMTGGAGTDTFHVNAQKSYGGDQILDHEEGEETPV